MQERMQIFGEADPRAVQQLRNCMDVEEGALGVLCADNHVGYSQPIGGAVAYREHISPSGVGYDIGCGNKAVRTDISDADFGPNHPQLPLVMDEIFKRISFGMGRSNSKPVDHPVLDAIYHAKFEPQRKLFQTARSQLGTVGAGNHYVDLFVGDDGFIWVGVHFGSRGFGHKTASGFLAMAQGLPFSERARKDKGLKVAEGEMDSPPVVFRTDSDLGQSYIEAMKLAGEYAYAGRDIVVDEVLDILGAQAEYSVHNHHNFAWQEEHWGDKFWVVRKGCTPAFPGQEGFVGATMGETSVILEGTGAGLSQYSLYSTVHGAGRTMSRTEAAGKSRRRWVCNNRDCDWFQPPNTHKPSECPRCGHPKLSKRMVQMKPGKIDWKRSKDTLRLMGIELRGGAADEAPGAYKRLDEVLTDQGDTIRVTNRLHPIGVAMAGADTFDPYKD